MLRPLHSPFPFPFSSPSRFFAGVPALSHSKSGPFSFFSAATTATSSFSATTTTSSFSATAVSVRQSSDLVRSPIPYGPSLRKGRIPSEISNPQVLPEENGFRHCSEARAQENDAGDLFDEESFTRFFDLLALRVPSEQCFSLESRLRGHLLNWPRIRNIARVPGDEVEDEINDLLPRGNSSSSTNVALNIESESLVSLNRRIYGKAEGDGDPLSPVLYRDKLAKMFNSRGFVKFRSLAKISRPKKKKKMEGQAQRGERKGMGKDQMAVVEVVEQVGEAEKGGDFRGLLGIDFKMLKWKGSTRLLLLDEHNSRKGVDQLPEAIKVLLRGGCHEMKSAVELVRCKLTLFYSYWRANEILEALLPDGVTVPSAFETVGHVAHLNLREEHIPYKRLIAKVFLDKNKPKIQTVVNKIDSIHNDYRTMQLEVLAGNHSLVTTVVENGIRFHVDLATVYWNSRLATERQRLLDGFTFDDVVCDVFAGVGPISISAARKVKYVYANDLNPSAVDYLERNCILNKLERKVEVFNMDGRRFIEAIFEGQKTHFITQVVMNLPNDAVDYLDAFRGVLKNKTKDKGLTMPTVHVYGFSKAQDPEFDFEERVRQSLSEVTFAVEVRCVRLVAPGKWMLCASFVLPQRVAVGRATPQ